MFGWHTHVGPWETVTETVEERIQLKMRVRVCAKCGRVSRMFGFDGA